MTTRGPRRSARPRGRRRWPWVVGGLGAVMVVALVVGAILFQPWLLFVDTEVDDEIPVAATTSTSGAPETSAAPRLLSSGRFIGHEHPTSGRVTVIEQPDGRRVVALENLDTTSGPDVHVWLSAAPVRSGFAGWRDAGGAARVDLGEIKGNKGNQVYEIPGDVDLAQFRAVVLWCVRFSVSFGAAELRIS